MYTVGKVKAVTVLNNLWGMCDVGGDSLSESSLRSDVPDVHL